MDWFNIPPGRWIPLGDWIEGVVDYIRDNFGPVLDGIAFVIEILADAVEGGLDWLPYWLLALVFVALALWRVGLVFGIVTLIGMALILGIGLWAETVSTLALVISATIVALTIGIPLG